MAKVIKCDRCGKIYEKYEDFYNGSQVAFGHDENLYDLFTTYFIYDLCPDCIKAVQEFIECADDENEKITDYIAESKRRKKKEECSKNCSLNHPRGHFKREFASEPVKNHYFWKFLKWLDERDIKMTIKSSLLMSQSMDFDFEHGDKHVRTTIHYDYLDFDNPDNDAEEFIKRLRKLVVQELLEGEE